MATIVVKIFALALRTAAKPLGHQFQQWAMQHPSFRQTAISIAQMLHRMEVNISRGAAGKESKAFVGRMSDEKALEMAAKVVSEGFVFSVGSGLLIWEYLRSHRADQQKKQNEEERARQLRQLALEERQSLLQVNSEQTQRIQELKMQLDRLEERFNGFSGKKR